MDEAEQRAALRALVDGRGERLSRLSRLIGRNTAYLSNYLHRGSPRLLPEQARGTLARYFGVTEAVLGGPETPDRVVLQRLDLAASAGPGSWAEDALPLSPMEVDADWLRRLGVRRPDAVSLIRVRGDSMEPTLSDGDEILVDTGDRDCRGVAVIRIDGVLQVKRLAADGETVRVISDNPRYPERRVGGAALACIGRVVWLGRRL